MEESLLAIVAKSLERTLDELPPSYISFADQNGHFDPKSIEGMVSEGSSWMCIIGCLSLCLGLMYPKGKNRPFSFQIRSAVIHFV